MTRWILTGLIACISIAGVVAADWTQWRGPNRDGTVPTFTAPAEWPETLTLQWSIPVGRGDSSPVLVGNRLYLFAREGENETLLAVDANNGKVIWKDSYPAPWTTCTYNDELGRYVNAGTLGYNSNAPKATPTVWNGRVFTYGVAGALSSVNVNNGELIWRKPPPPVQGAPMVGSAMSPLIDGDLVFVHLPGAQRAIKCAQWDQYDTRGAMVAYDAFTGAERWRWNGDGAAYASPIVATLGGTRQLVNVTEKRIVGLDVKTGKLLWELPVTSPDDQNVTSPLVYRDTIIYGALENPVAAVRPIKTGNTWTTEKVWENVPNSMFMSTPVVVDDVLYGFSYKLKGHFFAIDAKTGKTLWTSPGRQGDNASILYAGGVLLVLIEDGELMVMRPDRTKFDVVRRYTVGTSSTYPHPVIDGKRIFVRELEKLNAWVLP